MHYANYYQIIVRQVCHIYNSIAIYIANLYHTFSWYMHMVAARTSSDCIIIITGNMIRCSIAVIHSITNNAKIHANAV